MVDPDQAKIVVTIVATLTALIFIVLTSLFPSHATLWLSVEVVLLPSVYVIGSILTEKLIREEYNKSLHDVLEQSEALNKEYNDILTKYNTLKAQCRKN